MSGITLWKRIADLLLRDLHELRGLQRHDKFFELLVAELLAEQSVQGAPQRLQRPRRSSTPSPCFRIVAASLAL